MDKNKSEKLKEILNQTLSTEDIEKKLKEEIKNNAIKKEFIKEQIKEQEDNEIKNIEEEIKTTKDKAKEEVIIPDIRKNKKEEKGLNLFLYLVIIITVLLLSITVYLFTSPSQKTNQIKSKQKEIIIEPKNTKEELVLINKDKKEISEKILILEKDIDIDKKIEEQKNKEENKEENEKKNKTTEKQDEPLALKSKTEAKSEEVKIVKEDIKEKIVTKTIRLNKKNFKKYYNSLKYNTLKCYNYKAGDIFPTTKCKANLKKFLFANKNALRFEVIPVIAEDDNKNFYKMEKNIEKMDKNFKAKVKEYMAKGLSRERIIETSWYIKNILGKDTILTPTNYYVKSKEKNKGIIVKAYH
ncbi:MAG: hypothetical protein WBF48_09770 [Halarcobacter sp.]